MSKFGIKVGELDKDDRFASGADSAPKLWTPGEITASAELGAKVMFELFHADKAEVTDKLTEDYEAIVDGYTGPVDVQADAIVGLTLGEEGRGWISPGQLVAAYNRIATIKSQPKADIWECMYIGRPASWWNQRTPCNTPSKISKDPIKGLISVGGLQGVNMEWYNQKADLTALITATEGETTATEGMTPSDWLLQDTAALINRTKRPDTRTYSRFVQHDMDRTRFSIPYGPSANVDATQTHLSGAGDDPHIDPDSSYGFRIVVGRKST